MPAFAKMRELQARAAAKAKDRVSAGMSKQVAKVLNNVLGQYIVGGIDADPIQVSQLALGEGRPRCAEDGEGSVFGSHGCCLGLEVGAAT